MSAFRASGTASSNQEMELDALHRATSPSMRDIARLIRHRNLATSLSIHDIAEFIRLRNRRNKWTTTTAGTFTVKNDSILKILEKGRKSRTKCYLMTSGDIADPGDLVFVKRENFWNVYCVGMKASH